MYCRSCQYPHEGACLVPDTEALHLVRRFMKDHLTPPSWQRVWALMSFVAMSKEVIDQLDMWLEWEALPWWKKLWWRSRNLLRRKP